MYDDEGIRRLAVAVTAQAVKDYMTNKCDIGEIAYYVKHSPLFEILGIDEEKAIEALKERKAERYGKAKKQRHNNTNRKSD